MDTKTLVRFRNYLGVKEMALADRLIYEACKHIPVFGEILATPPEPDFKHRKMSLKDRNRLHQLVCELRLQIDIERGDY